MHYSEGHDPIVPLRTIGKCTHLKTAIMATAKTVRTFLIPKTLDSSAILLDARRPSFTTPSGFRATGSTRD
jgi:hypothetical protein